MIEFKVFSDDPAVVELIEKYWATDDKGKYLYRMADLLPFRDVTTAKKLTAFINEQSQAWNPNNPCPVCEVSAAVFSRTDRTIKHLHRPMLCNRCEDQRRKEEAQRKADEREQLSAVVRSVSESARSREIEYGQLPDDIALIVLALHRAICPKLIGGIFEARDLRFLFNGSAITLLNRLMDAGVVAHDPASAPPDACWLDDGELWYYPEKTRYFLVPDKTYGATEDALAYLANRPWDNKDRLRTLWLDYATAECLAYFHDECEAFSLKPKSEDVDNLSSQIRAALGKYSIQELWCAIWKIVKDAAAPCNLKYYNEAKATATLPGKLQRLLEEVSQKKRQPLGKWQRHQRQPAGTLWYEFYERFELNEETPGDVAMRLFANPTPPAYDAFLEGELAQSGFIEKFFENIHRHGQGVQVLASLADGFRNGLSVEDAVFKVIYEIPELLPFEELDELN